MSFQKVVLVCIASLLAGCASLSYPLPKCDGAAKRPLNRSMWQWQQERAGDPHQPAQTEPLDYTETAPAQVAQHPAFASFDEAGSRRACRAG
ncbi:type IV secretion system protein VirB7 [Rhizobium sp. PP-F2F-G48]|uniref:type IV secretion system protein VirB7 n=1 Tax=Rhizobium sp. PP-F2F-G48 TaxID=2135651 RepID=UPI001053EF4E|nr:type IV secretion system protein VirB7 [Rhizobium sp. PP-F2F-G48]TCM52617.1 type IV secretion system protein VirB7 [Rhizobium sp. PP-F2F-G48]